MPLTDSSIPAALREQVRQQPDAPAYTFVDYEVDPAGYSQSLTWSQLHRRAQVVAAELASCGSPGDRAAILAPQGFEYIVGVLGAMEAGFIAVPLSVPLLRRARRTGCRCAEGQLAGGNPDDIGGRQ